MTQHEALLRAVLVNPADDLPRLVYADWLEENGQAERAAFIRVQVELAQAETKNDEFLKADIGHDYPDRARLVKRIRDLRQLEAKLLRSTDPEMWSLYYKACWPPSRFTFRRGFLDEIRCETGDWIGEPCPNCYERGLADPETGLVECSRCDCTGEIGRMGPTILSDFPMVSRVELIDKEPYWNGGAWTWYTDARRAPNRAVPPTAELPDRLFLLLPDDSTMNAGTRWKGWATEKDANDALCETCVRWASAEAHLLLTAPTLSAETTQAVAR